MNKGRSRITIIIAIALILLSVFLTNKKVSTDPNGGDIEYGNQYCRPDTDPNPKIIQLPGYEQACGSGDEDCKQICILDGSTPATACRRFGDKPVIRGYVRVKSNVPIEERYFTGFSCNPLDSGDNCEVIGPNQSDVQHFYRTQMPQYDRVTVDGKLYEVRYPNAESGNRISGGDSQFRFFTFDQFGLVMLVHLVPPGTPASKNPFTADRQYEDLANTDKNDKPGDKRRFWMVDVYKDTTKPPLPASILKCKDAPLAQAGSITPVPSTIVYPEQNRSVDQKELQLEYFLFDKPVGTVSPRSWWTPECKPAIYLYPEKETQVQVTLAPKGMLTYTDPPYPQSGWDVTAYPDGTLVENGKKYPYLYYESKIYDELIKKPTTGFVVSFLELPTLYRSILPQLGLNEAETKDFVEYWQKALKYSPYYFVGIMDEKHIDELEPLHIQPQPDSITRVRVYFEQLQLPKQVASPVFSFKPTKGFRVVEWGGMVKVDKNHPFTCSQ